MNKENMIETTTKFKELKKEFNNDFYKDPQYCGGGDPKVNALKSTMDKLLDLLDELVRS
jgi:predicted transcriptional regulator of viral defense system